MKDKAARRLEEELKIEQFNLQKKEEELKNKVYQLKKALHKLLQEESQKFNEIRKKNKELEQKQKQVDLLKTFYDFGIKNQKEKHEKAKELVWQMKQKVIKLKELYKEILKKYKSVQESLKKKKREEPKEEVAETTYYPTVFCPDQTYCQDANNADVTTDRRLPVVYCPRKDFCAGAGNFAHKLAGHEDRRNPHVDLSEWIRRGVSMRHERTAQESSQVRRNT